MRGFHISCIRRCNSNRLAWVCSLGVDATGVRGVQRRIGVSSVSFGRHYQGVQGKKFA